MDALKTRILIAGDSFASSELSRGQGWPDRLAQENQVVNIAKPGIGEYKIMKSLLSQKLEDFDHIIVCHTSAYRLHCETNPLYPEGHVYKHSDVIFADAEKKVDSLPVARLLVEYFKDIYDPDYQKFVHTQCCEKIDFLTKRFPVSHLTFFEWDNCYPFSKILEFNHIWKKHPGDVCHLSDQGNGQVAEILFGALSASRS
jgi:hypothetical protein